MLKPSGPLLKRRDVLKAVLASTGAALLPTALVVGASQTTRSTHSDSRKRLNIGVL